MKERPILFNDEMVRAILDGRKTQTRRVVNFAKLSDIRSGRLFYSDTFKSWAIEENAPNKVHRLDLVKCPYGEVGDRLWVRECWAELMHTSPSSDKPELCEGDKLVEHATRNDDGRWNYDGTVIAYRATSNIVFCDGDGFRTEKSLWRPSIQKKRERSRITLEISHIRVERLQDISEADAYLEGVSLYESNFHHYDCADPYRYHFSMLWDSINSGDRSWLANPWVWVIEFKRIEPI